MGPQPSTVATIVVLSFIYFSLAVWWKVLRRIGRGERALPYEPRQHVPWSGIDVLVIFLGYVFCQGLIVWALQQWMPGIGDETVRGLDQLAVALVGNAVGSLLVLSLAWIWLLLRTGASAQDLGFDMRFLPQDLATGVAAFFALAVPVFALQAVLTMWFPPEHPLMTLLQERPSLSMLLIAVFSAAIVAPIFEEFLFRVVIQGWLEKVEDRLRPAVATNEPTDDPTDLVVAQDPVESGNPYQAPSVPAPAPARLNSATPGTWLPIILSAVFFALLHWGHGPAPIPLFFLALGLGYLYRQTHRIWPCIVVHAVLNSTTLAVLWSEVSK